jgi:hypothetical protein
MFFPIEDWFPAFLLTVAVETPIVALLLWRLERALARDLVRLVVVVVFANLATHLAVWYVFTQLLLVDTWQYLVVAEAWAFVGEALVYWAAFRGLRFASAAAVALVANLASFAAGRLLAVVWPHVF